MIRCPSCLKACNERDTFCRHCGAMLKKIPQQLWRLSDWVNGSHALRCLYAATLVFAVRVISHPLLMTYQGSRHEGRVFAFHMVLGMAIGLVMGPLRKDRQRWGTYLFLGLLGAGFSWALDYAYMADHLVVKGVFYFLNWLDSSPDSNAVLTNFGILQTLRFVGPVLALGLVLGWKARPGVILRILLFSLLALTFRFPVRGFFLAPELLTQHPGQAGLYLMSLFLLFYGWGAVDSNSLK